MIVRSTDVRSALRSRQRGFLLNPWRFGGGGGGGGTDPFQANKVLAMHFDGTNGSTTFTDQIGHGISIASGTVTISTTWSKFGGASGYFNTGCLSTAAAADLNFTTGDWAVRFFAYRLSNAGNSILVTKATGFGAYPFQLIWNGSNKLQYLSINSSGSLTFNLTGTSTLSLSTPYHIQIGRTGNNFYVFINGAIELTYTDSAALYSSGSDPFCIGGASSGAAVFNGYIDELNAYKGVGLDTANFTPQTAATPD